VANSIKHHLWPRWHGLRDLWQDSAVGNRILGFLLLGGVVLTVLLVPGGGVVAWLIVHGRKGLDAGVTIGAITLGVVVGTGIATVIAAVFGPPLFQRWLDGRPSSSHAQVGASPGPPERARRAGAIEERKQDRLRMREVLSGVKDELFPKRDT